MSFWKAADFLEKKNREIVKIHQQGKTASNIPTLFTAYIQVQEKGMLYFGKNDLNKRDFDSYSGKKSRLEVLLNAALNAVDDEILKALVSQKKKAFDDTYRKAVEIISLGEKAADIKKNAEAPGIRVPRDEAEAVSYLKETAPLRADLQKIESRYIELKEAPYLKELLQRLRNAIHLGAKSIDSQNKKASAFVFNQVSAVFQNSKRTRTHISNIEEFMRQKDALTRYLNLFDSIGDINRRNQIYFFISTIEKTINDLQIELEKEKQHEAEISEANNRKVKAAYQEFIEIKEKYVAGEIDDTRDRKKAVLKLKKCQDMLRANGQQIRSREIDRFLNATGIAKQESNSQHIGFYKRAFIAILPITLFLAGLNGYYMLSQDKDTAPVVQMEKKKKPAELIKKQEDLEKKINEEK